MKQYQLLLIASLLAVVVSIVIIYRAVAAKSSFDKSVSEALKTSEGYDQRFIDMVNRLEDLLATRAQFGYTGGKDPMTGTKRQVVQPKKAAAPKRARKSRPPAGQPEAVEQQVEEVDPVKLTAIIADGTGRKITAVVMDGERSYSVDPGDHVAGRKITRITNDGIYMETATSYYFYDIYGNVVKKDKTTGTVQSYLKEEQDEGENKPPVKKQRRPARRQ
ncbi:MAG: hypothetical protein JXA71_19350 [Chitinispirillaceae bacterium]|nr:hypothetical protein [Chitinispirillaceae bacterium]